MILGGFSSMDLLAPGLASETRLRGKRGGSFGVQEAVTPHGHSADRKAAPRRSVGAGAAGRRSQVTFSVTDPSPVGTKVVSD